MKSNILKNFMFLGGVQFFNYVFPLLTIPYVSRIIGPQGYGIMNYLTIFVGYFGLLISYGFDMTATRQIVGKLHDPKFISKIFSQVIFARIFLFILSVIIFIICIPFFEKVHDNLIVAIIVFSSVIGIILTPQYIYQSFQDLKIIAVVNFFKGLINTILVFLFVKKEGDYVMIVFFNTVLSITIGFFLFIRVFKIYNLKLYYQPIRNIWNIIWQEKMIYLSNFVIAIYTSTNIVVLGFFASNIDVGYISIAQNFMNIIITVLSVPIVTTIFPHTGIKFSESKEKGIEEVRKILPIIFYLTFIFSFLLFCLSNYVIILLYGSAFTPSIKVLKILSFIPVLVTLGNLMGVQIMVNMRLDKLFFSITAIGAILGFTINYMFSKNFGYIGTAWSFLIIEIIITLMMFISLMCKKIYIIQFNYFSPKSVYLYIKNLNKGL